MSINRTVLKSQAKIGFVKSVDVTRVDLSTVLTVIKFKK